MNYLLNGGAQEHAHGGVKDLLRQGQNMLGNPDAQQKHGGFVAEVVAVVVDQVVGLGGEARGDFLEEPVCVCMCECVCKGKDER